MSILHLIFQGGTGYYNSISFNRESLRKEFGIKAKCEYMKTTGDNFGKKIKFFIRENAFAFLNVACMMDGSFCTAFKA